MLRIAGVNVPNEKRIVIALTYIYGIGSSRAEEILKKLKINPDTRTKNLTEEEENKLRLTVEKEYKVEGFLRRDKMANIKRMQEIRCYRGIRHHRGLPVRGQNTKTNSRTVRGNVRKTMGSGRAKAAQKT